MKFDNHLFCHNRNTRRKSYTYNVLKFFMSYEHKQRAAHRVTDVTVRSFVINEEEETEKYRKYN